MILKEYLHVFATMFFSNIKLPQTQEPYQAENEPDAASNAANLELLNRIAEAWWYHQSLQTTKEEPSETEEAAEERFQVKEEDEMEEVLIDEDGYGSEAADENDVTPDGLEDEELQDTLKT